MILQIHFDNPQSRRRLRQRGLFYEIRRIQITGDDCPQHQNLEYFRNASLQDKIQLFKRSALTEIYRSAQTKFAGMHYQDSDYSAKLALYEEIKRKASLFLDALSLDYSLPTNLLNYLSLSSL